LWPTSAANTSIELIESRTPIIVLEKVLHSRLGRRRHATAAAWPARAVRKRVDDGLPMLVSVYPEGVDLKPAGLFGGLPGQPARGVVLDARATVIHDCGTGELVTLTGVAQRVEIVSWPAAPDSAIPGNASAATSSIRPGHGMGHTAGCAARLWLRTAPARNPGLAPNRPLERTILRARTFIFQQGARRWNDAVFTQGPGRHSRCRIQPGSTDTGAGAATQDPGDCQRAGHTQFRPACGDRLFGLDAAAQHL
jgi:hypothetical protein